MASSDLLKIADHTIREHLREQCQRLINAGYPDAAIIGSYGTDACDKGQPTVWCNVNLKGLGGNGIGWQGKRCSLIELEIDITEAIENVALRNRRFAVADKMYNKIINASDTELDILEVYTQAAEEW